MHGSVLQGPAPTFISGKSSEPDLSRSRESYRASISMVGASRPSFLTFRRNSCLEMSPMWQGYVRARIFRVRIR